MRIEWIFPARGDKLRMCSVKLYLDAAEKRGLPTFYLELVSGLRKGELTLSRPKTETSVRKVSIPKTRSTR